MRARQGISAVRPGVSGRGHAAPARVLTMTDPELIRRAEAAGIAPAYLDWRDERVEVSGETLAEILAALDSVPEADERTPGSGQEGAARLGGADADAGPDGASAVVRPRLPGGRSWGFTVQLYSVRSRQSWGHGDLHDLADLASWSARDLGRGTRRASGMAGRSVSSIACSCAASAARAVPLAEAARATSASRSGSS
jgi:hypothetical protein